MSTKLLQNFDYLENFSLNGNAAISDVHKFGNKSVAFSFPGDSVSVSNYSGLFNLSHNSIRDFECFFKSAIVSLNYEQIAARDNSIKLFNGHAFKLFYQNNISWHDAKYACETIGGHLATSTSADKNDFLNSIREGNNIWLGGTDENDESNWRWITGETWSYSNWNDDEPSNDENSQHFLAMDSTNGYWDDKHDTAALKDVSHFICEWDNLFQSSLYLYGYRFFNGHSFKFFNDSLTWLDAKKHCEAIGGHLATSTSADKNDFLHTLREGNIIWLGGTDENDEGNWRWITGETWDYSNWYSGEPNNKNNSQHYLSFYNSSKSLWGDAENDSDNPFICEWDFDFSHVEFLPGYIFNFDNSLSVKLNQDATLLLVSPSENINATSSITVSANYWHHIRLRVLNGTLAVYLDGQLAISATCSNLNITPDTLTIGGFSGYIDEFAVLDDCDTHIITPARPYQFIRKESSAPVKFANWSSNNLPQGLTLSQSGLLEGTPTVTGTFDCNVSLSTNWGTANKSLRIVIQ